MRRPDAGARRTWPAGPSVSWRGYVPLTAVPGDKGDRGLSIRRERGYWSGRRS